MTAVVAWDAPVIDVPAARADIKPGDAVVNEDDKNWNFIEFMTTDNVKSGERFST